MKRILTLLAVALWVGFPAKPVAADRAGEDRTILHVLNRLGFGPRPGDVEAVRTVGLERYIELQLHPERIDDADMDARTGRLTTVKMSTEELVRKYEAPLIEARREQQRRVSAGSQREAPGQAQTAGPGPELRQLANTPLLEVSEQKLLRAIYSERQIEEVLTDFWFNHFNVDSRKGPVRFMLTEYERDAIRPHVLGRFRDLLGATAKSPAMLFYLDNWLSAAPPEARSQGAPGRRVLGGRGRGVAIPPRRGGIRPGQAGPGQGTPGSLPPQAAANMRRGLNENYARELMELHTLGVDGGYTQQDVTEVARVFTGWTISQPRQGGGFRFEPRLHDQSDKTVLGHRIPSAGISEGEEVLDLLARHPSTARFIATKLARRFVSDDPPPALVERAARTFRETDGDLREVTRVILTSPEFLSPAAYRAKVKTPLEFVVGAVRATGVEVADARLLVRAVQTLGMPLYQCQPPTGYRDSADTWANAGALIGRMNFALVLANRSATLARVPSVEALLGSDVSETTLETIAKASEPAQALALALGSPEFQRR